MSGQNRRSEAPPSAAPAPDTSRREVLRGEDLQAGELGAGGLPGGWLDTSHTQHMEVTRSPAWLSSRHADQEEEGG